MIRLLSAPLVLAFTSLLLHTQAALTGDAFCNSYMCVQGVIQNNQTAYFQIETSYNVGWISIGIGSSMAGSDLMVFWPYLNTSSPSNYSTGYSRRQAPGFVMPTPISDQSLLTVISPLHVNYTQRTVIFQFSRPVTAPENTLSLSSNGQNMVWAYCDQRPSGSGVNTNIAKHVDRGHFSLKLGASLKGASSSGGSNSSSNGQSSSSSFGNSSNSPFLGFPGFQNQQFNPSSRYDKYVIAHAVVMFLSLAFFMPLAVLFPAALRSVLPRSWFPTHVAFQLGLVLPLAIAGAYLAKKASMGTDFVSRHQILGLIIYIIVAGQFLLGIGQNIKYRLNVKRINREQWNNSHRDINKHPAEASWDKTTDPSGHPPPTSDPRPVVMHHIHYFVGYSIAILVLIQIPFGLQEYGPGSTPFGVWLAWWIYTGILMAAWIASIGHRVLQARSRVRQRR